MNEKMNEYLDNLWNRE